MLAYACFREEKPNTMPTKSFGRAAQVIKPGWGHLTELVEVMPFSPSYILSLGVSLSHFKILQEVYLFSEEKWSSICSALQRTRTQHANSKEPQNSSVPLYLHRTTNSKLGRGVPTQWQSLGT